MAKEHDGTRTGAQAVDRALGVLGAFLEAEELTVTEVAVTRGLSVSTAHRLLQALVRAGYIGQDTGTERYRLGPTAAVLGLAAAHRFRLDVAQPLVDALSAHTSEAANVGIRDGADVVIVLAAESNQPLRFERGPGSRTPIHASAIGKVLLAFDPGGPDHAMLGLGALEPFTRQTITDPAVLRQELEQVVRRGMALNREERFPGVSAVAVPVHDDFGNVRMAVGVQAPSARLTRARVAEIVPQIREVADQLAAMLPLAMF